MEKWKVFRGQFVKTQLLPFAVLVLILVALAGGNYLYERYVNPTTFPEVKALTGTQWSFQQYSNYFRELAQKRGGAYAFKVLLRAPFPPGVDLHLLAHVVGDVLYTQKGLEGIKVCTQDFRNACSHSIVIGYLREHGEGAFPEIIKTCREAPGGRGAYTMCFHGLGHGVLAYTGYDFEKAIAMCKKTGSEQYHNREYVECVGGATMELMAGVHDRDAWEKQKPKYFKANDPLYPCDGEIVPDDVKGICYMHLTPHLFESAGGDLGRLTPASFEGAMRFCSAIPRDRVQDREACFGGFGKEYIVLAQGRDIRDIGAATADMLRPVRAACALAHDEDGERACNASAQNSLFWGGENTPDGSYHFCEIAPEGKAQDECYQGLAGNIAFYLGGTARGQELCERLPQAYQGACMGRR